MAGQGGQIMRSDKEVEEIVTNNIGLVKFLIKRYYPTVYGDLYDELLSLGMMGLVMAAQKFDPSRGSFSVFAGRNISTCINHRKRKSQAQMRIPEELIMSLNTPVDDNRTIQDIIETEELSLDDHLTIIEFMEYLQTVEPCNRKIVELYFGLNGEVDHDQQDIGNTFNMSQIQVSRIIKKVLEGFRKIW